MRKKIAAIRNQVNYVFFIAALSAIAFSCEQKEAACKANCKSIGINGKIVDGLTSEPVPGIPLVMEWHRDRGWLTDKPVAKFKSADDGTFKTSAVIDSSKFASEYYLMLMLEESNKYLTDVENYTATMNDSRSPASFTDLRFTVYPKVPLTIKLKRTQHDNFGSLSVTYYFKDIKFYWAVENGEPGKIRSAITVYTCPDVFTKIEVSKVENGGLVNTIDSIKCSRGKNNIYTVNY